MSEGQSYDNVEFMNSLPRVNGWDSLKTNASTGLTIEQIEGDYGIAYQPYLVKYSKYYFNNRNHRHEVLKSDPIAIFLLERWIAEVTAKPFKSYDVDIEGNPEEIMTDFWELWDQLNMNEALRDIYPPWGGDGYCVGFMYPTSVGTVGYKTWGFYESPPEFWKRYNIQNSEFHNVIYEYKINIIPVPSGYQYLGNYNIHAEEMFLYPDRTPGFFHFTRGTWNYGVGNSKVQPIWSSMTKLREIAYADYRRSSIFNIFEYPEDWDESKGLLGMIEAARRANARTGIAVPKRVNKNTDEVEDWPKFYERTWDTEGGSPKADPSSGGSLLRSAEYARLLIPLGYTETKLVGSQPGEVTGSKLDLTRDDQVDIREFNLLKPVIKWMAEWLLMMGFLEGLEPDTLERIETAQYDIKCHVEWEVLENQVREAELAAEQMEDQAEGQAATQNVAPELLINTRNNTSIMGILKENVNIPMGPIGGGKMAGIQGGDLMVKFPNYPGARQGMPGGGTYAYHFGDPFAAQDAYTQLGVGGGSYIWRALRGHTTGPAYLTGNPTPGGTSASLVPYDIMGGTPSIAASAGIQQPGQQLGGGVIDPLAQSTSQTPWQTTTSQTPSQGINYTGFPTIAGKAKTQKNPKGAGRKGKKGRKKGGTTGTSGGSGVVGTQSASYVPATAYNSAKELSFSKANSIMKEARGKGWSKTTWGEVKRFIELAEADNLFRFNSMDIGNPMSFDVKLRYMQNGSVAEEYACKREWRKVNNHKGNLYLYENLEHGGARETVGSYKYFWDKITDMPMIKRNYDDQKIRDLHKEWKIDESPILDKLNLGLPLSMSTEYYCGTMKHNGKNYQVNIHNGKGESILKGIAIVKKGNCDDPFCSFKAEEVT